MMMMMMIDYCFLLGILSIQLPKLFSSNIPQVIKGDPILPLSWLRVSDKKIAEIICHAPWEHSIIRQHKGKKDVKIALQVTSNFSLLVSG